MTEKQREQAMQDRDTSAHPLLCSKVEPSSLSLMPSTGLGAHGSLWDRRPQWGQTGTGDAGVAAAHPGRGQDR